MTKQEFENAEQKLKDSYVCDSDYYPRLVDLDSEYIASLEAENERLTKAVEKAMGIIDGCPTDEYVCPKMLEHETIRSRCDRCIKLYLLGDE